MKIKEFIKKELSYWKAEIRLQDWMIYCMIAGVMCFSMGLAFLFLWGVGALVLADSALAIESSIIIVVGLFLLGVFAWHYTKMNHGSK